MELYVYTVYTFWKKSTSLQFLVSLFFISTWIILELYSSFKFFYIMPDIYLYITSGIVCFWKIYFSSISRFFTNTLLVQ